MKKLSLYSVQQDYPKEKFFGLPEIAIADERTPLRTDAQRYEELERRVAEGTATAGTIREMGDLVTKYSSIPRYDPDVKDWEWVARVYNRDSGELIAEEMGGEDSEEEARRTSQTFAMSVLDKTRRKGV